jgi:AhpD family alkylhydroperoxidase
MSTDYAAAVAEMNANAGTLYKGAPDVMGAFQALEKAAHKGEALDDKIRELMAVAISIAIRCEACIAYHMRIAVRNGASREEALETIAVAVEMGGGPSVVYGGMAIAAYDQFAG